MTQFRHSEIEKTELVPRASSQKKLPLSIAAIIGIFIMLLSSIAVIVAYAIMIEQISNIVYFDYSIVKYFESIAKIIKKSTKHELFDFLGIEFSKVGGNIKNSSKGTINEFSGHILPEEHSSFKEGYKLVSFYMDADSLIKRAYVLRHDGWRDSGSIGLYQRMFIMKKIKSMRKYLHEEKRVFINNIIVTLPTEKITIKDEKGNMLEIDENGNFVTGNKTTALQSRLIGVTNTSHNGAFYEPKDSTCYKYRNNRGGDMNSERLKFDNAQYRTYNAGMAVYKDNLRFFQAFDANDNILSTTYEKWDASSSSWVNDHQYLYTYNVNNNMTGYTYQTWGTSDWVNVSQ